MSNKNEVLNLIVLKKKRDPLTRQRVYIQASGSAREFGSLS